MNWKLQVEAFQESIEDFRKYVRANNYKNGKAYVSAVLEMMSWMEKRGMSKPEEVSKDMLLEYFNYLMGRESRLGKPLSESHLKNCAYSIELYLDMLLASGKMTKGIRVPRKVLKGEKAQRDVLTLDEIKLVYQATESNIERVILSLGYGCGLRRSEIMKLDLGDIRFKTRELFVREGKGRKFRTLLMDQRVMDDIQNYIRTERHDLLKKKKTHEKALLINWSGNRMSGNTLNKRLLKIVDRVEDEGLQEKHITLHCLRHSIATHFLDRGVGMEFIQRFLGHAELDTSQIYAMKKKLNKYKELRK